MGRLLETQVRNGLVRFEIDNDAFLAEFIAPGEMSGTVTNENKWRLSRYVYHGHRRRRKVQRVRQIPRFKELGYFDSLEECRKYLRGFDKDRQTGAGA